MLAEPPPTQADLHFRIAGFPVRVHPFFWAIALVIGLNSYNGEPTGSLLAVGVIFVSILVHELGHAVVQHKFGGWPRIVLHGFGGLAICNDCDRSPRSQILISLAGPVAGFLLAIATIAFVAVTAGYFQFVPNWSSFPAEAIELSRRGELSGTGLLLGNVLFQSYGSSAVNDVIQMLLWVNIFWGLMNLLPVYPLDGGQVAREVMTLGSNPQRGIVLSLQLSIGVAAAAAFWGLVQQKSLWLAILFGFLAYNNYRTLQAYTGRGPGVGWR